MQRITWIPMALVGALLWACGGDVAKNTTSSSSSSSSSSGSSASASSSSSSASGSVNNEQGDFVVGINAGGAATDVDGNTFGADQFFADGMAYTTTDAIANTTNDVLFQSERYGQFTYRIPVTDASYSLILYFSELYQTVVGAREFNVTVEGQNVLQMVDIFAEVGHDAAFKYAVNNVQVTDGALSIDIQTVTDNGTLAGIAVYSSDGGALDETALSPGGNPGTTPAPLPGADCYLDVSSISKSPNSYPEVRELPNPFVFNNGSTVQTVEQWACRHQELSSMIQAIQYGPLPPPPTSVSGSINGGTLSVSVNAGGRSASFNASIAKPSGNGPFPAIVVFGGFFGVPYLSQADATSRGIAYINLDPSGVSADNGTSGAFYSLYGSASPRTGNLMAWAWGVHRIIDAFENNPSLGIDASKIGVTGYSRYGKAALVAGAFDDRVALTIPGGGGHGGPANWRTAEDNDDKANKFNGCCETVFEINGAPFWFTDGFVSDWDAEDVYHIPFDAHSVIALVAPRAIIIQEGTQDTRNGNEFNVAGPYKSAWAARKVYEFLGAGDLIGFVADAHGHGGSSQREKEAILALTERVLLGQGSSPAVFDENKGNPPSISWDAP